VPGGQNALLENAFCPPNAAECSCAALRTKMVVVRENDEYGGQVFVYVVSIQFGC
jgi:hypothetical protein